MDIYELQKANPGIFPQFAMNNVLFLHYTCPQTDNIVRLYSKHMQFIFPLSGERILHHGNKISVVTPENGNLLKKCVYLQELPQKDNYEGFNALAFYLKDEYLLSVFEEFRPHLHTTDLPQPSKDQDENIFIDDQIRSCYESIIPYVTRSTPLPESILESKFKELLFNIFAHPENRNVLSYIISIVDQYKTPIWEVMEANYTFDLGIKEFANIANRSISTFKRDFYDHYKTTPGKWVMEKRLLRAKYLLETTKNSITSISFDTGFKNVSHFSRVFKEKYGQAPSEFKNN
jgi:AraC-like DNA-binding protein